jgi:glycosyltransferase involved in cell wall biosynthesis
MEPKKLLLGRDEHSYGRWSRVKANLGLAHMFVTVGICTFNRAESLRRTLNSLGEMQIPSDVCWEILIVNNNSSDHTDEVIANFRDRLPVRREFEPRPGKSNALNRAIDVAKGEYILWTDDDVVVDPRWLQAYVEAFRRWPEAALFGGRIVPKLEPPVPRWVAESISILAGPYAIRDCGDHVQPLSIAEDRVPYGANFAIRSEEQRAFRYDPNLGPSPLKSLSAEEADVIERLLESGAKGYWIPKAIVQHCIGQERQTISYVTKYSMIWGETDAFRRASAASAGHFWFGVPRGVWKRLVVGWGRCHVHRLLSPAPVWVMHLQIFARARGAFLYWRKAKAER